VKIENVLGDNIGYVELQDMMGSDLSIVNAARTSYLGESKGEERDKKLLRYLWKNKHMGPFEFAQLRLRMKVPLFVQGHIVRHRMFGFNIQSYRYVEADDEFYFPVNWRLQDDKNKQGSFFTAENEINSLDFNCQLSEYCRNAKKYYDELVRYGIAREMARIVLPQNIYSTMNIVCDLRNLLHFTDLRSHPHAQWETRQYSDAILHKIISEKFPWTYEVYMEDKNESL
jgi:thymidylate synthase (FAD)